MLDESREEVKRSYQTIRTVLERLIDKEFLSREKFGPIWLYTPIRSEKTSISSAIDDFIKTVLGNKTVPFIMHVLEKSKNDNDDIKELKKLIDDFNEGN